MSDTWSDSDVEELEEPRDFREEPESEEQEEPAEEESEQHAYGEQNPESIHAGSRDVLPVAIIIHPSRVAVSSGPGAPGLTRGTHPLSGEEHAPIPLRPGRRRLARRTRNREPQGHPALRRPPRGRRHIAC